MLIDAKTEEEFAKLKEDGITLMASKSKSTNRKNNALKYGECNSRSVTPTTVNSKSQKSSKASQILCGLSTIPKASTNESVYNDTKLFEYFRAYLNRFIKATRDGVCPLQDNYHMLNYSLELWKKNMSKFFWCRVFLVCIL